MNNKYRIAQTDNGCFPPVFDRGEQKRLNCILRLADVRTERETLSFCRDSHIVLATRGKFPRGVLERMESCAAVIRLGVGVETIDLEKATDAGIVVANVPDFCLDEVSDTVACMVLALNRKLFAMNAAVRAGRWDRRLARPISRLRGQTLGLVGFGRIARAVAAKMRGFGLEIIAYDPHVCETEIRRQQAVPVTLEELLARADIVSLHVPLTVETHHLISVEELFRMKRSAYLINTSRGEVADSTALLVALGKKWIAGAALDVMESEPPKRANPLLKLPNVIVTPHFASYSEEAFEELVKMAKESAQDIMRGRFPEHTVNPGVKNNARLLRQPWRRIWAD